MRLCHPGRKGGFLTQFIVKIKAGRYGLRKSIAGVGILARKIRVVVLSS